MKLADAAATSGLVLLALGFLVPVRALCQDKKDGKGSCANNMKQLALAAIQYADDKRFFPHIAKVKDLDNGGDTTPKGNSVPPRTFRALMFFNYIDNPDCFECPAADDEAKKLGKEAKEDIRAFGWMGSVNADKTSSPLVKPMKEDADADALTDLSYGYTLRGLTINARSDAPLAADRARRAGPRKNQKIPGNHKKGYTVAHVDGHTTFVNATDEEAATLAGTKEKQPALVVWDETTAGEKVEKAEKAEKPEKKAEKAVACDTCGEPCPADAAMCPHCGIKRGK